MNAARRMTDAEWAMSQIAEDLLASAKARRPRGAHQPRQASQTPPRRAEERTQDGDVVYSITTSTRWENGVHPDEVPGGRPNTRPEG